MTASISIINLLWAVVGITDRDIHNSFQSMKRPNEPIEITIERYVIGHLLFWHITFIDKEKMNRCHYKTVIQYAKMKMKDYFHKNNNLNVFSLNERETYLSPYSSD